MKLCKDCKHYKVVRQGHSCSETATCTREAIGFIDLVTGKHIYVSGVLDCYSERNPWVFEKGTCGKEGKFWESK